jgi:hypothetical protein
MVARAFLLDGTYYMISLDDMKKYGRSQPLLLTWKVRLVINSAAAWSTPKTNTKLELPLRYLNKIYS